MDLISVNNTNFQATLGEQDGKSDASVHVGALDRLDSFIPNLNSYKWNNEAWFNLNPRFLQIPTLDKTAISDFKDGVASVQYGNILVKTWVLNSGVLEYSVCFASNPGVDRLEFDLLHSNGLSFYSQPELTQIEINDGAYRPPNVVGSIAVYHNKKHNDYKTGKLSHWFRWEAIDAIGKKAWCGHLFIDSDKLIIPLPVDFLKTAKYPVVLMGAGDSFGYVATPGTAYEPYGGRDHRMANSYSPSADGTATHANLYMGNTGAGSVSITLGLYDSAGNKLQDTAGGTFSANAVLTQALDAPQAVLAANTYMFVFNGSNTYKIYYDTAGGNVSAWSGAAYSAGNLSASVSTTMNSTNEYGFFVTFTPAGGSNEVSTGGALDHSGAISRLIKISNAQAGVLAQTGVIERAIILGKELSGSFTQAGLAERVAQLAREYAGTFTMTGAAVASITSIIAYSATGELELSGAIARAIYLNRSYAGTLVQSGSVDRQASFFRFISADL